MTPLLQSIVDALNDPRNSTVANQMEAERLLDVAIAAAVKEASEDLKEQLDAAEEAEKETQANLDGIGDDMEYMSPTYKAVEGETAHEAYDRGFNDALDEVRDSL